MSHDAAGKLVSIVIPVYNNEKSLSISYERIHEVFTRYPGGLDFEIVFVNDGSHDGSYAELLALRKRDARVKVLSFTRNFGQMAAMLAGFSEARGDAVINISADLQDPIDLMPEMIDKWRGGAEVVVCYRESRDDPLLARVFSRLAYSLMRVSIPTMPPGGFDYVLMDRAVMDLFNSVDVRHRFFQGDLLWSGHRVSFISYKRLKREHGKSQYTFFKKLKNLLDALLDSSYLPIRFISLMGIFTSFGGLLYSITVVVSWFYGGTPFSGFAPIMIAIMFVGGMIMTMLGILGEYVWRIYDEIRKKPNYIVRDRFF
jgi:glycosyltransferase involved in cell wall biosynthesis